MNRKLWLGAAALALWACTAAPTTSDPGAVTPTASAPAQSAPVADPEASAASGVTVHGRVEDDHDKALDGVTVTATLLDGAATFADGAREQRVTTASGQYELTGCPMGITLKVVAKKRGWTTRTRTLVTEATNTLDFTSEVYQLSDRPEVIQVTPNRAASGVAQDMAVTLTFSESMDTDEVEDNLRIGLAQAEDGVLSTGDRIEHRYLTAEDDGTSDALDGGSDFYDDSHLDFAWSSADTQLTVRLKPGHLWVSDRDPARIPTWALYFDGGIEDDDGNDRTDYVFRLTDSQEGWFATTFKPFRDQTPPKVLSVQALDAKEGYGDRLLVKFSETLVVFPDGSAVDDQSIPGISRSGYVLQTSGNTLATLFDYGVGASASPNTAFELDPGADGTSENRLYFDEGDESHATVVLEFDQDIFAVGDRVVVRVEPVVTDPAGNLLVNDKNVAEDEAS